MTVIFMLVPVLLQSKTATDNQVAGKLAEIDNAITPQNTGITMYDAAFLFDMDEKGELWGNLKEVVNSLDEDNNPVLVKIIQK